MYSNNFNNQLIYINIYTYRKLIRADT